MADSSELLRAAVAASGLSQSEFASQVLGRDPRTARRWAKGQKIPVNARQFLERYVTQHQKEITK